MISAFFCASARVIRSASLLMAVAVLVACERGKSPPVADVVDQSATQAPRAADTAGQRVQPESSPEGMRAFAAAHLRSGLKPGDFLTNKRDYPSGDTADVYRAVLDTLYVSKDGFPGQVVLYADAMTRAWVCGRPPCPILPEGTGSEPKMETVDAYRIATLNRRHITPNFKYHIPLTLMSETDQREMEIDGRAISLRDSLAGRRTGMREVSFWLGFQARYPHAWGYTVLSVVGMNPKKTEAILQVSNRCGTYCHSTETMILWKVRGQWHVIERVGEEGDSTELANTSLRYRGVGLHTPQHEAQEFARRDSIRLALPPRDIHGRITTRDGKPLPGATIELHMKAEPNAVWRVASDFRGDYRFLGVLVGRAGLVVRCPKTSNRPDTMAAETKTEVADVRSVEANVQIDGAACEDTPPVGERQIEPALSTLPSVEGTLPVGQPQAVPPKLNVPMQNELDGARARASAYPNPEEAAVYAGVFDRLGSAGEGKVILLYGATRFSCKGASCNEDYRRRIRYEPRVMLSAMENFLTVREQQHDFRADFPGRPDVSVVGDSAIAALERATSRVNAFADATVIQQAWPNVAYSVSFSAVGFSAQHKQAIVEMMRSGSEPLLCILNRTATGWQVVRWIKL